MSYNLRQAMMPLSHLGIKVEARRFVPGAKSQILTPESDGFLFSQECSVFSQFILAVKMPRNVRNAWVVSVYGRGGNIAPKTKDYTPGSTHATFAKMVSNRPTDHIPERGVFLSTKHDGNNLRIILAENGIFEMYEVAIPMRAPNDVASYFLTVQKLYSGRMYNRLDCEVEMSPECEIFHQWENLRNFLNENVELGDLVDAASALRPRKMPQQEPTADRHLVKYFCLASGLGKAQTHRGEAFIRWPDIISAGRFACLEAGQLVAGNLVDNGRGLQLTKILGAS